VTDVETRYLTVPDVERSLLVLERHYGLSTTEFYERYYSDRNDPRLSAIPQRHRSLWASLRRTHERMTGGGGLADRLEHELQPV
jgi:hypothetical protein